MQDIINQIRTVNDRAALSEIARAVRDQETWLAKQMTRSLVAGDTVRFDAKTRGIITGKVIKINPKTVKVRCDRTGMIWRVAASLLERVGEAA